MAAFVRQPAEGWDTIPGTRWFRADLHLHTVDDLPGKRAKFPAGLHGAADDPAVLRAYARAFLQAAIVAQIGVLGVTPHAVRCAEAAESSAVWTIVDTWNTESDDDGVPFRNKIFAVFPGFEPSFRDGKDGLHLQILFDPEIGRERFLKAFELMMGGVNAYEGGALQISSKSAEDALAELRSFADRTFGGSADFAVLAPHAESDKGLFKALAAQVLKLFDHGQLTAIELGDNTLPEEIRKKKGQWFEEGLARYRLALYHSSDAYKLSPSSENDFAIGNRFTWLKLATPTIEGLRQAFLAHESRLRIAYVKDSQGKLTPSPHAPSANAAGRTWLKQLTVKGPAAFFGGQGAGSQFVFSPDLTCIIGSSMSGKSTLLDGLRLALHARLPARAELRQQVEARAQNRFSAGRPDLEMQWQPHAPANDRLPLFFTQSELQTLAEGSRALEEDVIARLLPGSSARFEELRATIRRLDGELRDLVPKLKASSDGVARAAQQMSEAEAAETRLAALKDVGYDRWQAENRAVAKLDGLLKQVADEGKRFAETLDVMGEWGPALESVGDDAELVELASAAREAHCSAKAAVDRLRALWPKLRERLRRSQEASERVRHDLEKAVAAQGTPADGLLELRQLADRAKYLESYRAAHLKLSADYASLLATFTATSDDRAVQRAEYRSAMREVAAAVQRQHEGRIEMDLVEDALVDELGEFVRGLRQSGITGWWNNFEGARPSPFALGRALEEGTLSALGMSPTVATRFLEAMTEPQRHALKALPCHDGITLKMRLPDGTFRPLNELSGGQRVALVLSLLLSADDDRPLVIDQPEDDIDNRFLADTILPALRRLKGKRQVILATHNANIVVNGDADLVIQLEATAAHGSVGLVGAIEAPAVRTAIIETVDGGAEAFALRQRKYGY